MKKKEPVLFFIPLEYIFQRDIFLSSSRKNLLKISSTEKNDFFTFIVAGSRHGATAFNCFGFVQFILSRRLVVL